MESSLSSSISGSVYSTESSNSYTSSDEEDVYTQEEVSTQSTTACDNSQCECVDCQCGEDCQCGRSEGDEYEETVNNIAEKVYVRLEEERKSYIPNLLLFISGACAGLGVVILSRYTNLSNYYYF